MGYLTAIASAISSVFNWITGRSNLNNQPAVVKAKEDQVEVDNVNKTNNAIDSRDTKEIENEIS